MTERIAESRCPCGGEMGDDGEGTFFCRGCGHIWWTEVDGVSEKFGTRDAWDAVRRLMRERPKGEKTYTVVEVLRKLLLPEHRENLLGVCDDLDVDDMLKLSDVVDEWIGGVTFTFPRLEKKKQAPIRNLADEKAAGDLVETCPDCKGTGVTPYPEVFHGFEELRAGGGETCPTCEGTGTVPGGGAT